VRLSKRDLRSRVKSFLPIEFTDEPLTSHAGLELFRRFCERAGWLDRLQAVFSNRCFDRDYGSFRTALLVVGMLLLGGSRLSHLRVLDRDPLFLRFVRLRRLPDERTFSRGLQDMIASHQEGLNELLREVTYRTCEEIALPRATIELDGTVLRTGECVDGAERGFNPHHPKDPSYYPLTAHLAQTGQMLGVWNRPGNVNDSAGAAERLAALIADVRTRLGAIPLEVRLDGAFFQKPVLEVLTASRAEYGVKVPMWKWLGVRQRIAARRTWERVNSTVDAFSTRLHIEAWHRTERIVVFRKRVAGETRKNFQLDLFSPDDGHYEYSMVATNKPIGVRAVWAFMAGRGGHEKTLGELKQHFAFGCVPTQDWDANSAWQLLSALTHNLVRHFQVQTGALTRPNTRKRTCRYRFLSLQTLRFTLFDLPGRIAQPAGRTVLRIAASAASRQRIREIENALAA
jgi:hypothetical protein